VCCRSMPPGASRQGLQPGRLLQRKQSPFVIRSLYAGLAVLLTICVYNVAWYLSSESVWSNKAHNNDVNVASVLDSQAQEEQGADQRYNQQTTRKHQEATTSKQSVSNVKDFMATTVLQWPIPPSATIYMPPGTPPTCESTIVTAYFNVPSKFPSHSYTKWMGNILSLQDCMIIFTYPDKLEEMQQLRSSRGEDLVKRTMYITLPLDDLPIAQWHAEAKPDGSLSDFWPQQLEQDKEKKRHQSYQLFWIWLSKTWFVSRVIHEHNVFNSQVILYSDMGCYRNPSYNGKTIMQHPEIIPRQSVLWMAHRDPNAPPTPYWNDKFKDKQFYFHSGSSGVAYTDTWLEYHEQFSKILDAFVERNLFVGEDQCVLQATCQANPDLCAYVLHKDVKSDNNYFGLRSALHHGGEYAYWRMPGASEAAK
jgi:Bacterial protein of unknown function (HtrL_YibB)